MSMLANDYRMYYRNSYVGVRVGEEVRPFLIQEVSMDYSEYDPREAYADHEGISSDDIDDEEVSIPESFSYHPDAYNALRFHGRLLNYDGSEVGGREFAFSDMVFDNPDLGYIRVGNNYHYITYRPIRAAKKGVVSDRIFSETIRVPLSVAMGQAFNPVKDPIIKLSGALLLRENVEYKGRVIGTLEDSTITLTHPDANWLKPFIERDTGCRVIEMDH